MAKEIVGDYRKYMNKNYLGSWDVPKGKDLILTIDHCEYEEVQNQQGKELKLTLHFSEREYKPMILNKTNSAAISTAIGSTMVEEWAGNRISIYTTKVPAFGSTTDALRIRDYLPKIEKAFCEECGSEIKAVEHEGKHYTINKIVTMSKSKYDQALCWDCAMKRKEADNEQNGD